MTAHLPTVTCIGELLWDVLPAGRNLGGAPANVAYHLAQLKLPVRIVTRIGRDELGEAARAALQLRGLPVGDLQWDEKLPTGAAHVTLDVRGQACYRFITPAAWDALETPAFAPDVVVFGTLAQRDPRSRAAIRTFVGDAPTRVYDVNLRPPFTPMETVLASLPLATSVKLNDEEMALLAGALGIPGAPPEFADAIARRFGIRLVCITRGAAGAGLWCNGRWSEVAGSPIAIADTVGAGDAFLAALIRGMVMNDEPQRMLERANRLGAYVASQHGAMPAYEDDTLPS